MLRVSRCHTTVPVVAGGDVELLIVLVTGVTTGGLTCLAVQGGLLASVVSAQANAMRPGDAAQRQTTNNRSSGRAGANKGREQAPAADGGDSAVLAFLGTKLVAYTILGFLLGATGSLIGVSPT